MAKFYGRVGYAHNVKTSPGVYEDQMTERSYFGDVVRNTRRLAPGEHLSDDISVSNSISIVADAYANNNIFAIRYVEWMGILWKVETVEVQSPRLLLTLGDKYNGPVADTNTP